MIHPELCAVSPPESGENLELAGDWVGGWMDLRDNAQTMSLDGKSGGTAIACSTSTSSAPSCTSRCCRTC